MPDRQHLRPDRYYVIGDAGGFYEDETCRGGFETPEAAAEWARRQTTWQYGAELDFSDGMTSIIALGADLIRSEEAWETWDGDLNNLPEGAGVRNYAVDLELTEEPPFVEGTPQLAVAPDARARSWAKQQALDALRAADQFALFVPGRQLEGGGEAVALFVFGGADFLERAHNTLVRSLEAAAEGRWKGPLLPLDGEEGEADGA